MIRALVVRALTALLVAALSREGAAQDSIVIERHGADVVVVLPPESRPSIALDTVWPANPARRLLCSEQDAACGLETAAWITRAEKAFADHALREAKLVASDAEAEPPCMDEAMRTEGDGRYFEWLRCESSRRPTTTTFPLDRFRAPTSGWLLLRGRRGHYHFCDEVRAYDLATGTAYLASRCGSLLPQHPLPPEHDTSQAPGCIGRVPVDALREAAFMLILGQIVRSIHAEATRLQVPASIVVPAHVDDYAIPLGRGVRGWSSDTEQTLLSFEWIDDGLSLASGRLQWPYSSRAVDDHAANLIQQAESRIVPGCDARAVPPVSFSGAPR